MSASPDVSCWDKPLISSSSHLSFCFLLLNTVTLTIEGLHVDLDDKKAGRVQQNEFLLSTTLHPSPRRFGDRFQQV